MADNKIKISVNLDSKEFDQNFKRIMDQVNKMRQATSQISRDLGSGGDVNTGSFNKGLQKLQTTLSTVTDRTDTFNKSLASLSKTLDNLTNKATQAATAQQTITPAVGGPPAGPVSGPPGGGPPGGGPPGGGPPGPGGGMGKGIKFPLTFGKMLGFAGTAVAAAGEFYKQIGTYPERIAKREATMADMMSESARLQAQGRGYEMSLFGPERMKALERASTRVKREKVSDITELGGTVLGTAGIGAGLAAKYASPLLAAPMGIGLPAYAAAVGIGGIAGGLTGFAGSMLTSDRKRSMLFDRDAYQKEMGAVFAGTYKEQLAAERAKSYEKDLAAQFIERESGRFTTLQRGFGLSDEELFTGDQSIFRRAARGGYGMDTMTQAMQGISGAGGSTRVSVAGGQIAAQLQRNLDLTNAPQLMGRISGATGMNEIQSKDAIIRMYAEATRIGLDTSETREFLQAAAETGYRTGGDLKTITGLLSAGVQGAGLEGPKGIEAAQTALEKIRQQTSEMGGLTGQYGLAELGSKEMTNALGGKALDLGEKAYLLGTDVTKISDEYIQNLLEKRGMKAGPEEIQALKEQIIKGKTKSGLRSEEQEKALQEYQKTQENAGVYSPQAKRAARIGVEEQMGIVQGTSFLGLDQAQKGAYIGQMAAGLGGVISPDLTQKTQEIQKKYETESARMVDEKERSAAMDTAGALLNLKEQTGALITAFQATTTAGEQAAKKLANLGNLADIVSNIKDPNEIEKIKNFTRNAPVNPSVKTDNYGPN